MDLALNNQWYGIKNNHLEADASSLSEKLCTLFDFIDFSNMLIRKGLYYP